MARVGARGKPRNQDLEQQFDQLRDQLEHNRRVLEIVYNISLICRGRTSFREIFELTYRELGRVFSLDACYIALCDTAQPDIFRAVFMVDEGVAEYHERMEVGSLTGILIKGRQPLLFRDLLAERAALEHPPDPFGDQQKRSRSWLGVPLLVGQDAVGVISIQSYQVGLYDATDAELLQRLGNLVAVALENANLAQQQRDLSAALANQVAARTVELAALSTIAAELVQQQPLPTLLARALDLIVPLLSLEGGNVRLLDPRRNELVLVAHRGFPPEYVEAAASIAVEGSQVLGSVVAESRPLAIPSGLGSRVRTGPTPPFESMLSVPIRIGERVLGTLGLLGKQAHTFDQQEIDLAQAIGNQIAIAIENTRLFEEQARQIGELRALSSISRAASTAQNLPTLLRVVHDALQSFMQLDAFSMVVFDPERQVISDGISIDEGQEYAYWSNQPPPPDSLNAWVIRNRQTLHFNDMAEEIQRYPELGQHLVGSGRPSVSWLGVPLLSRDGDAIGAIAVQGYQPGAFDERDETFLLSVARQVALHVQNVRLLTQRERQIRELDAIGRIGQLISASYDLDEMLQGVYETLQSLSGAPIFYLLICDADSQIVTNAVFIEQGRHNDLGWVGQPPVPGSMTDWIIRKREPMLFGDLRAYLERTSRVPITPTRFGNDRHARSWVGVPLLAKDGESIGVLSLQDYRPDLYDEQTIDFLRQVASHISLGVQKVRLFEERERQLVENARLFAEARAHAESAERQAERMELVNRISLLLSSRLDQQEILDLAAQEVVRLFRADHTGTVLFDEAIEWGTVVAEYPASGALGLQVPLAENPLTDELLTLQRPVCIASIASDERARVSRAVFERLGIVSLLIVPLISRGRTIGSISLDVVGAPRAFTQEEQTLFLTVAASIASAVENARLFAAEQAARRTADTLREVARVLSSSFDPREVLQLILRELRNVIVYDSASIMLLDRGILRIAAHTGLEENPDLMDTTLQLDTRGGALLVARQRQPVIISDTAASPDWIVHEGFADIRSWLGVPLILKGDVLGVLNIDSRQVNHFTARDAEAARAFADQAAVALENARLYEESVTRVEQELEIASRIQSNLFPRTLPRLAGLPLDARCLPARETGGDFFDFVTLSDQDGPGRLAIMVGDASGKSIPGAMLMAVARSIVRSEARDHQVPQAVMRETNRWIARDVPPRSFVALCYATLDLATRRLALANAGQLAPLRRRPDRQIAYLEVPGPTLPLGILPDTAYAALELTLEPGDLLVFYTDGIVEAQDASRQLFGFERLEALVREFGDLSPADLIDIVLQSLGAFMRDMPQHDDMTIVALRVE